MNQRKTMKIWQMIVIAGLLLLVTVSMFFPVYGIKGSKVVSAQQEMMQIIKDFDYDKFVATVQEELKDEGEAEECYKALRKTFGTVDEDLSEEDKQKLEKEIDESIEDANKYTGINLASISGWRIITTSIPEEYKKQLEKSEDSQSIVRGLGTIKIVLGILYFGALLFLILTILGFALRWNKMIMSIADGVYALAGAGIMGYFMWGLPGKLASESSTMVFRNMDEEVLSIVLKGGLSDLTTDLFRAIYKGISGVGFLITFIVFALIFVMAVLTILLFNRPASEISYNNVMDIPVGNQEIPIIDVMPKPAPAPAPTPTPVSVPPVAATVSKPKMGKVVCTEGVAVGKGFQLPEDRKIIVGKSVQNATLVIPNQNVSNVHCSIRYKAATNSYIVKDHSTNGTFINGVRLQKDVAMECAAGTVLSLADGSNKITLG